MIRSAVENPIGLWNRPDIPRKGWELIDVVDAPDSECQMCGNQPIRYVHIIRHDDWPEHLDVGCVCAEHLTEDYKTPRRMERQLVKRIKRQDRFVSSPRWKVRSNGNHVYRYGPVSITICPDRYRPGRYCYVMNGNWFSPFDSVASAKAHAFKRTLK